MVQTGLDRLVSTGFRELSGAKLGVVCNQATVAADCVHILDHLLQAADGTFEIIAAFGPQHGIWGHTQDNMIEWEGYLDPATGLRFFSLYGEHRKPTPEMLAGIDCLVFDIQDVGARYYTFMWTLMLCMEACEEQGIRIMVLDRPNPIGGVLVQGTVLDPGYASFVGLRPLPMRHGMTMGELARYFAQNFYPRVELTVHEMTGWRRGMSWEETGLPWVMPSPNMPTPDTALVYPGQCLIEGTKMSEGRGTTRSFEMFGATYIDGRDLCTKLNAEQMPGVHFRPIAFEPTFHKFAKEICEGAFIHVRDAATFDPVLASVAILRQVWRDHPGQFAWGDPPYEYEYHKLPIDILNGNQWLREAIESFVPLAEIADRMRAECEEFAPLRDAALIYSDL